MIAPERGGFPASFPLVETKLVPLAPRPGTVERSHLVKLLADGRGPRIVSVIAPPGYGKTTLLAQWVPLEPRPVAWLTVDELDDDPSTFLTYVAAALDRVVPLDASVAGGLGGSARRVLATAVPRLASELDHWKTPAVLVLDDTHLLRDRTCLDALALLLDHLPPTIRVVIAGRSEPDLPFARFRARQDLLEIGPAQLALDESETAALALAAGCRLDAGEARALALRTEGWAAGIYLAALARARGESPVAAGFSVSGADHYIAAYLRTEVEHSLDAEDVNVLTRTAILEQLTPAIAEAVTEVPDAAGRIARLAHDNLLIQRLGGPSGAYRYHNLLHDYLLARLQAREPGLVPELHRRAARWYEAAGWLDLAIEHAFAAGDTDTAAGWVIASTIPRYYQGRVGVAERWMTRFTTADFERRPPLAVMAAWVHALTGHAAEADRLADIAEHRTYDGRIEDGSASLESQRATLRALMCRNGPRDMLANAAYAVAHEGAASAWRPHALYVLGAARLLLDDRDEADRLLAESIEIGAERGAPNVGPMALRARLRLGRGDVEGTEAILRDARAAIARVHLEGQIHALPIHALGARTAIARGDVAFARAELVQAQLVRPLASHAIPWISVTALLDIVRAYLAISDTAGAQLVLREAEAIVRVRPALGTLTAELLEMRKRVDGATATLAGSSTLTAAEVRILLLLPTYLSFQDIADRLSVSRNTVKTHATAIYGKLWASSRGEAVERAIELGLLEPYPGIGPSAREGAADQGAEEPGPADRA